MEKTFFHAVIMRGDGGGGDPSAVHIRDCRFNIGLDDLNRLFPFVMHTESCTLPRTVIM
jgi:hypothetical protein